MERIGGAPDIRAGTNQRIRVFIIAVASGQCHRTYVLARPWIWSRAGHGKPGIVNATGQVASGANVICFTTGRGSVFGCKPTPSLKLASNTTLYNRMSDDMDINCGTIIDGDETVDQAGQRIFDEILAMASGKLTRSEVHGFGEEEFQPWVQGATL